MVITKLQKEVGREVPWRCRRTRKLVRIAAEGVLPDPDLGKVGRHFLGSPELGTDILGSSMYLC